MKRFVIPLVFASALATASFAQADDSDTIRICDANGCSERSKDSSTFQVPAEDPVVAQRTAALIERAKNDPRAAWDLGLRYFRGDGVRKDAYQALQWMRDAGERGNLKAQLAVGRLYLIGLEEMGPDPIEAESWLSMAAAKGNKEAKKLLVQARRAKINEREEYQWRESERQSLNGDWSNGYSYYLTWGSHGWHDR